MKYDDIIRNKIEYKLKRAKLNYHECGEKAGKLLASRLKKQMTKSTISCIRLPNNSTTTDPDQINKTFTDFYENLYKSDSDDDPDSMQEFLKNIDLPCLSEEEKNALEQPITQFEINKAIN